MFIPFTLQSPLGPVRAVLDRGLVWLQVSHVNLRLPTLHLRNDWADITMQSFNINHSGRPPLFIWAGDLLDILHQGDGVWQDDHKEIAVWLSYIIDEFEVNAQTEDDISELQFINENLEETIADLRRQLSCLTQAAKIVLGGM